MADEDEIDILSDCNLEFPKIPTDLRNEESSSQSNVGITNFSSNHQQVIKNVSALFRKNTNKTQINKTLNARGAIKTSQVNRVMKKKTSSSFPKIDEKTDTFGFDNDCTEIFDESQIPASIEEVIATVNTAQPTICQTKVNSKNKSSLRFLTNKKFKANLLGKKYVSKIQPIKSSVSVLASSEELIKLKKESETDSDVDIDIDDDGVPEPTKLEKELTPPKINLDVKIPVIPEQNIEKPLPVIPATLINKGVPDRLLNSDIPNAEWIISHDNISEDEKYFNHEFFEGRWAKTPERYLKIRNHILNFWYTSKPEYVTKTSVRSGLKTCGDVNSIGRVHLYLEQIGAINFGCANVRYVRPLIDLFTSLIPIVEPKPPADHIRNNLKKNEFVGQRHKKKLLLDGEGGCTFAHNELGEVIETTVVNSDKRNKPKPPKKPAINLIPCQSFSDKVKAPYDLKIEISALLPMDWHAHTSLNEVMGLLGGTYDASNKILTVKKYVACQSSTNSATHCDMCPVSQSVASEKIQHHNLDVVGWFHSHPTFSPNPSQQDLETQIDMQQFVRDATDNPFLGIILSPFGKFVSSHVSEFRCLIIRYVLDVDHLTKETPFKFHPNIVSTNLDVPQLMEDALFMFMKNINIDLEAFYFHDIEITYLQKILDSTRAHLMECEDIDWNTTEFILDQLKSVLQNRSTD